MRKTDLAYFAGIFDGEGTVTLARISKSSSGQKATYRLRIGVTNTNEWICQQFRFSFGGSVSLLKKTILTRKPCYRWTSDAAVARICLETLKPYTKLKLPQIELALKFLEHKKFGGHKTEQYMEVEKDFKMLMSKLNKRGVLGG